METPISAIKLLFKRVEDYSKSTLELSKLKSLEYGRRVLSSFITRLFVLFLASIFVLILNIGVALFLGELLGGNYYGFFIVSGFYLLACLSVHFFLHKRIKRAIGDFIIKEILQ